MMIGAILVLSALSVPPPTQAELLSVCIETTINSRGRFTKTKVHASSGSNSFDNNALRLLEGMDDLRKIFSNVHIPQTGYLVLIRDANGNPGFVLMERLLTECPRPESDT